MEEGIVCQTQFTCWAVTTSTKSVKEKERKRKNWYRQKATMHSREREGVTRPCFASLPLLHATINVERERERNEDFVCCVVLQETGTGWSNFRVDRDVDHGRG